MARRPTLGVSLPPVKETSFQISAVAFLRRALPPEVIVLHIPNGEVRDKATAGKLKAMGVLPGAGDLLFQWPRGQGSYLELKVGDGKLSDDQVDFKQRCAAIGWAYAVAYTMEEVEAYAARCCAAFGLKLRATLQPRRAA